MASNLKITLILNGGTPRSIDLGPTALVGSGRAADIRVPDISLAPLHLRLSRDGAHINAIALAPGVSLDGEELAVDEVYLVGGRTIDLGPARIVSSPSDARAETSPQRTESLARELVRELMGIDPVAGGGAQPEFIVEAGPANGQRLALSLKKTRVIVGRGETATWVLLDPDLSRSHAAIERGDDGVRIYDLRSKNGTKVNGKPVAIGGPGMLLEDGATISLGDTRIRYVDPAAALLADLEAQLAAVSSGMPGAITQTRPGHGHAEVAAEATVADQGRLGVGPRVAIAIASLIVIVAFGLLVALLTST